MLQTVGRRDQFVQTQTAASLFGDGVADVGVGVDERRKDDLRGLDRRLLDRGDFAMLDDHPAFYRVELWPAEDGSLDYHVWEFSGTPFNLLLRERLEKSLACKNVDEKPNPRPVEG